MFKIVVDWHLRPNQNALHSWCSTTVVRESISHLTKREQSSEVTHPKNLEDRGGKNQKTIARAVVHHLLNCIGERDKWGTSISAVQMNPTPRKMTRRTTCQLRIGVQNAPSFLDELALCRAELKESLRWIVGASTVTETTAKAVRHAEDVEKERNDPTIPLTSFDDLNLMDEVRVLDNLDHVLQVKIRQQPT